MTPTTRHPATWTDEQLLAECSRQTTRRTGPGGQHRNKVETAVVLTHKPTGLRGEGSETRSQALNGDAALFRLRQTLAEEIRCAVDVDAPPSDLWRSRTPKRKLTVSDAHADFPALLAEALDRAVALEYDLAVAAAKLAVSTTQLVRFLQQSPVAWQRINAARIARNLRPLS
jgi:hypothetical protein